MADDVVTFEDESGKVFAFHVWGSVNYIQEHEVTDKPTAFGTKSTVVRRLPRIVSGKFICADGMTVSAVGDGSEAVQSGDMKKQLSTLYALEGKLVTVYSRSIPIGGVTGIFRSVNMEDSGQYDNSVVVSFAVRTLTSSIGGEGIDSVELEEGEIRVPLPVRKGLIEEGALDGVPQETLEDEIARRFPLPSSGSNSTSSSKKSKSSPARNPLFTGGTATGSIVAPRRTDVPISAFQRSSEFTGTATPSLVGTPKLHDSWRRFVDTKTGRRKST